MTEAEYLANWIWPSADGTSFYCRINHQDYATKEEAVEAVRKADKEAGIKWPWESAMLCPVCDDTGEICDNGERLSVCIRCGGEP